ncbi:hypothetical protein Tco_0199666 [Tanacetum coccineum]
MSSSKRLINNVGSIVPLKKRFCRRNVDNSSYHALGACFSPYSAFFNLKTWLGMIAVDSCQNWARGFSDHLLQGGDPSSH